LAGFSSGVKSLALGEINGDVAVGEVGLLDDGTLSTTANRTFDVSDSSVLAVF
jgi:hypothetical protein